MPATKGFLDGKSRPASVRKVFLPLCVFSLIAVSACAWNVAHAATAELFPHQRGANHRGPSEQATAEEISSSPKTPKRAVTVADAIQMTRIAGPGARNYFAGELTQGFATFSPDGKRFVMIIKRGNLQHNTNEYSLLLYKVDDIFHSHHPRILASFASSSNRPAINQPSWLADNNTVLFLGEQPGQTMELYEVLCHSGKIRKLTDHKTNLLMYSASADARRIAYIAEPSGKSLINGDILRAGLDVSNQSVFELITGRHVSPHTDLFLTTMGQGSPRCLEVPGRFEGAPMSLSPDGRYLVVSQNVSEVPTIWRGYRDERLESIFRLRLPRGSSAYIPRYELVDTETGQVRVLLDAPANYWDASEVAWSKDSRSVILTGVYLPLNVSSPSKRSTREKSMVVVELNVSSLRQTVVVNRDLRFVGWGEQGRVLELERRGSQRANAARVEYYRRRGGLWEEIKDKKDKLELTAQAEPEILCEQGLNAPPKVVAMNPLTRRKVTLLDLNPQLQRLALGKVEVVRWPDGHGHIVEGGLYLPPNYVAGRKYPLVIQGHGFNSDAFWIDGPFSTANAAQPLAGQGIVVLQVPDLPDLKLSGTPEEAPRMMEIYENAIDFLSRQGIVDPKRVGLIGFSHTCWYVQFILTHSKYHFAAAIVADGIDGGYFQYLLAANANPFLQSYEDGINGASPFGDGLPLWMKRSPGFLLDKVQTPVQIQAIGPFSALTEWEWFAGLLRLKKPVDMIYIPTGYHILQKPWDRLVSQQAAVDWFCFWLKGEILNPADTRRYKHLRHLRNLMLQRLDQRGALIHTPN